ncbi:energy-coupling factor transporter ATP-binding protein EcfA2 [Marmoricola sp. OAE513]|uniref:ATP-binding protein n=1 Tax=Marmoricola sp. OAE513 TaxID=2817894 RepID=UPI001AE349A7
MSNETMEKFRCWSGEKVAGTVFSDIGALASDADAIFLAAHTPVELDRKKGTETDVNAAGEAQVLKTLLADVGDGRRNTLIAVTGESGSGKSHVVRWVNAHVSREDDRYRVLYVPRAVQTLRALLHKIVSDLPGVEGTDLLDRVDAAIGKASPGELKDRLVNEMRIALNWTIQPLPAEEGETPEQAQAREDRNNILGIPDEQGRRRDGLADLLEEPQVSKALLREGGRLDRLVASYYDETSRRDDSEEAFTEEDLPVRVAGIRRTLSGRPDLAELWSMITTDPTDALSLLEDALRQAVPATLGLRSASGGDTLDGLFRRSRQILKTEGRELILIFEDLTQFGLVDGELYDQFATAPSDEVAPLRVVFAVTDGAFARMDKTVSTRVTDVFEVGGSALSDPQKFVGRYLNLVRVGAPRTRELWTESGQNADTPWMENACATRNEGQACQFLDTCHASFGKVEIEGFGDVGLYPYSVPALRRAITHLGDEGTPRLVLDECISTNLTEADPRIADGTYPHDRVRDRFDRHAIMAPDALVDGVPASERDRAYLARLIWGDEVVPLPAGIEEAFSLTSGTAKVATTKAGSSVPTATPKTAPVALGVSLQPSPLEPLWQWQNGAGTLIEDEANYYRATLLALTQSRLQLDQDLVHVHNGHGKAMLAKILNQTSFYFEGARGAGAGKDSVRFDLKPTSETVRILVAARWFRDHGHFDPALGIWEWPAGFKPEDLMVQLESTLDEWAAAARDRFLQASGGQSLAADSVGIRAVALAALGHDLVGLRSTADVLAARTPVTAPTAGPWGKVQVAAEQALGLDAQVYVAEFAAVRQGSAGAAQLVDTPDLDLALESWLSDPVEALRRVKDTKPEPALELRATALLAALEEAADAERQNLEGAVAFLNDGLGGLAPSVVADQALQIGDTAKKSGHFRPSDGWGQFSSAVKVLEPHAGTLPVLTIAAGPAGVLQAQHNGRRLVQLAGALRVIQRCLKETKEECLRTGSAAGDVEGLRTVVKTQIADLDAIVNNLTGKG